ncbi:MAG: molybdopterin-synthase adenylyltransferase MoeB [Candidatus Krumholzibacteriia bacterium]|nr:molybdopterin-synthase adenylyltransferase MoeB [bacterium]MCB9514476.1 molybdopterin-synthase adenylyltransferase MoeB [Candidatus Latescibacterota bacterium]MCB9515953.1 molybdopterin-synthase adenylyltransferase MoeB [Candidatus Latescibacterota bacterium]
MHELPELEPRELARYARHVSLPELGERGQRRLKAGSVLLVGAGGLGSPAALYLAAAGVGRLGIVDFDAVDLSNLQRQVLHGTSSLGVAKVDSAAARLADLNPDIVIERHPLRLTAANARALVRDYDVVLDGSDSFATRYLVNDACGLEDRPLVYGSIFRFEGQAAVFHAGRGPCYRCLFPAPPPPEQAPNCAEGGVLGVLPGIIGTVQATEAIKLLLDLGETLLGRLLLFDALEMRFREFTVARDPACALCGDAPTITEPVELDDPGCAVELEAPPAGVVNLTPRELAARLAAGDAPLLLDVRNPFEWRICHLDGALLLPLDSLLSQLGQLDPARETVIYCHTGVRSAAAAEFLHRQGFRRVANLLGGIHRWSLEVDPSVPTY